MNWEAKDLFDDSVMEVYECTSAMSIYPQMGCEAVIGDEIRMRSEVGRVVGSLWIGWRWSEGEWWWEGWWWGEVSHSEGLYNLWPDDLSYHQLNLSLSLGGHWCWLSSQSLDGFDPHPSSTVLYPTLTAQYGFPSVEMDGNERPSACRVVVNSSSMETS